MEESIGLVMAALAAIVFGLTTVMQKHSLRDEKKFSVKSLMYNKTWIASILVGLVGLTLYFMAIAFSKVYSVQSIITASVIIPILAGYVLFKEEMRTRHLISIGLILIGIIIVIL